MPWVKRKFDERGGLSLDVIQADIRRGDRCELRSDTIKIDVESAEVDVLDGLQETIALSLPVLLIESRDWHGATSFLSTQGHEPYRFLETDGALVPFFGESTNTFYIHQFLVADGLGDVSVLRSVRRTGRGYPLTIAGILNRPRPGSRHAALAAASGLWCPASAQR